MYKTYVKHFKTKLLILYRCCSLVNIMLQKIKHCDRIIWDFCTTLCRRGGARRCLICITWYMKGPWLYKVWQDHEIIIQACMWLYKLLHDCNWLLHVVIWLWKGCKLFNMAALQMGCNTHSQLKLRLSWSVTIYNL